MSEYKKLMARLGVVITANSDLHAADHGTARFAAHMARIDGQLSIGSSHWPPTRRASVDIETFDSLFRQSMREPTFVFHPYQEPPTWELDASAYQAKKSKFGKRERNKVQVPKKEIQVVNSNSHTKKRKKRK